MEAFSTVQGLGVGQTREAVDGGVQVGVANPGALAPLGGLRLGGTAPMSPPASPRWDASNLLDVQVDHMARETSQDRFADPVGLSGGAWCRLACSVRLCPAIRSHGTHRYHCPTHGQLVADAAGGPLVSTAPVLDEVHRLGAGAGGAVNRGAGTVLKLRDSSLAVTSDPLRHPWHERYRLQPLHERWGDRPGRASRAGSGPEASKERYGGSWQRGFLLSEG